MPTAIDSRYADVNGVRLHYLTAGAGTPVGCHFSSGSIAFTTS